MWLRAGRGPMAAPSSAARDSPSTATTATTARAELKRHFRNVHRQKEGEQLCCSSTLRRPSSSMRIVRRSSHDGAWCLAVRTCSFSPPDKARRRPRQDPAADCRSALQGPFSAATRIQPLRGHPHTFQFRDVGLMCRTLSAVSGSVGGGSFEVLRASIYMEPARTKQIWDKEAAARHTADSTSTSHRLSY